MPSGNIQDPIAKLTYYIIILVNIDFFQYIYIHACTYIYILRQIEIQKNATKYLLLIKLNALYMYTTQEKYNRSRMGKLICYIKRKINW